MATELDTILRLEIPFVVVLAERQFPLSGVRDLVPGTIIELPKNADEELEIRINNRPIGTGSAVKVGENFGIRMDYVGDLAMRAEALAQREASEEEGDTDEVNPEDLAAALLSGQ